MGVFFGAFMAIFSLLRGVPWPVAVTGGAIGGVFFGAVMGPLVQRQYRRQRVVVAQLTAGTERAAGRAVWRGPVPEDPEVREAAARLADFQLAELRRRWPFTIVAAVAFVALATWLAVVRSPWWWFSVAVFLGLLVFTVLAPRRLQRRAERLRHAR